LQSGVIKDLRSSYKFQAIESFDEKYEFALFPRNLRFVFPENSSTQEEIWRNSAFDIVHSALRGFNGAIYAYGEPLSGKTFTMYGPDMHNERGILPRAIEYIFSFISEQKDKVSAFFYLHFLSLTILVFKKVFNIQLALLESTNNKMIDLLNPRGEALRIRESEERGVYIEVRTP